MRVSDFGEVIAVSDPEDVPPDLWLSPTTGVTATPRLLESLRRGEATIGGLAEAGWRKLNPT